MVITLSLVFLKWRLNMCFGFNLDISAVGHVIVRSYMQVKSHEAEVYLKHKSLLLRQTAIES